MSDDSDSGPQSKHKRKIRRLEDNPRSSSSLDSGPEVTTSRRKVTRRLIDDDSDSDSGSSIEVLKPKRRSVPRVATDEESDSSGSVIIKRAKRPARVVSDSNSDSEDSDHGFEGSSSSQWETDLSDNETPKPNTAKVQDTGVDSDSSDGQSEKCPICLISFNTQEIGTPESCDHMFCVECIQEWSKNMNTCPVDRQEFQMILVRKSITGKIYRQIPIQPPNPQNEVEIVEDPTFCEVCGQSDREDRMLLCDGCDLGFHLECLNPPLLDVPAGAWFCNDCSPEDLVDPEIELYELQLLLDDANEMGIPRSSRRGTSSRLVPRTRQTERVRRRIENNRNQMVNIPEPGPNNSSQAVSSTTSRRRVKRKRKRKPRYRVVYQIDEVTGETIATKKRVRRRKKRTRRRPLQPPKTVKKRLAMQLGICAPRNVPQNLPDVRIQPPVSNIQSQRYQAGIPTLDLFGQRDEIDFFSGSEDEVGGGGTGILTRRAPNRSDVAAVRRSRVKTINLPSSVSSTSDILDSILDSQAKLHSKKTKFSLGKDGKFTMEESQGRVDFRNYEQFVRRRPTTYSNNSTGDSVPSSSGHYQNSTTNLVHSNTGPTSTVESSSSTTANVSSGDGQEQFSTPQDYTQTNLCTLYDVNLDDSKDKPKKNDDASENNTPRSGTPASESEIDIYSDIETVSTSKVDDAECKSASPLPTINTSNNGTDDDNNDSEPDMVIDTDKTNQESEENTKEETIVTSTVDSNTELISTVQPVTSTSEIQSQAIQSSNELFDDKNIPSKDDDEDSEDGCPNFSIYSKESITMAKNTDISLGTTEDESQSTNQVGEISSSPAVNETDTTPNETEMTEENEDTPNTPPVKKVAVSTGLYSDSEDESVVKKGLGNSFGISDIRNITEDISEEERSYTPCLDERGPTFREGIEGLDTEMISDEERNDFDESHDLKTVSDGDALEINAKESELDITRPEDYEEGEIVDKLKNKKAEETKKNKEETKKPIKKKDDSDKSGNKENESQNTNNKESSGAFKKLSKNNKERNYRDKDRERSKSREKKDKDSKRDKNKKEKRKEIERYDVRALIAEKPRRLKDKFGRDIRRSASRSKTRTPSPRRSLSRSRRSASKSRRSPSKTRRSASKRRSLSRDRNRKKRRRSRRRTLSRSKSRSIERKRSRSKTKKRRRSLSRERRRKSRERSKGKTKKHRSRSRHRSRSPTPKRTKEWSRRQSRDWSPSISRSRSPEARHLTPSWTPPRMIDNTVKPHNLTVILTNDANKKKKEKKRKTDKKVKENERQKKRKRSDRTPPPSKEVFASGDNILVSVSFNKDNETRDVSTKKRKESEEAAKKNKKEKVKKNRKKNRDLTGVKPVAIIDLERSPFKELTPSPKDVIVLSDSDNEEARTMQKGICDSSQQVASPERCVNAYSTGPKTPPEPQVKFTLTSKQTQMRAISNPLHEPDDIEPEGDTEEVVDGLHKGPNTPPEPPNSPPSSPDAYDPFEPTKSRSATPEPNQTTQSNSTLNLDDNRDDSIMESRTGIIEIEKSNNSVSQTPDAMKSHTPPLADVQPADSQSSIQVTPESSLEKSPERSVNTTVQTQAITASKPVAQTIPFSSSVPTSIITSTPVNSSLAPSRINILNSTIITPPHVVSSIPQRIVLPNTVKSSPVKISPTKAAVKSTPVKPMMTSKTSASKPARKSSSRNQNGSDTIEASLSFDSPYSPGSSDYEDLFEPPAEAAPKPAPKPANKNAKSPNKVQNAFDSLFGTSPFNKNKPKQESKASSNKYNSKKSQPVSGKGTKQVGVKLDEDNLKILDELPNSAVEMQVKDKFLKKLNRQERVVEEVKLVLKPHYNKKHISKDEYKDILRRAVPKICHNKSGEINPTKIKNLIEAYIKKVRHSKKVTSSSSSVNPQKA